MHSRPSALPFYKKLGYTPMELAEDPSLQTEHVDLGKCLSSVSCIKPEPTGYGVFCPVDRSHKASWQGPIVIQRNPTLCIAACVDPTPVWCHKKKSRSSMMGISWTPLTCHRHRPSQQNQSLVEQPQRCFGFFLYHTMNIKMVHVSFD